jgi:prolipoprotein diacylglyceryltransferase
MHFLLFFLFLSFLVYLFVLHVLAREDWVLMRKNVTLEQLFNIAVLTCMVGLFFARVFYVVFNPSWNYLNLLVFFLVPYFPGLSLPGGILGALLFLVYYAKLKKFPFERVADLLSTVLLLAFPVGLLGTLFLKERPHNMVIIGELIFFPLLYFIMIKVVQPAVVRGEVKDGTSTFLTLMSISLVSFLANMIPFRKPEHFFMNGGEILFFILFLFSLVYIIRHEFIRKRPR